MTAPEVGHLEATESQCCLLMVAGRRGDWNLAFNGSLLLLVVVEVVGASSNKKSTCCSSWRPKTDPKISWAFREAAGLGDSNVMTGARFVREGLILYFVE